MTPRQIKFRVWKNGKMTYSDEFVHFYEFFETLTDEENNCQQFTGLLDKNNKEIYEGDIVEFYSGYPNQTDDTFYKSKAEVKFEGGAFWPRPILEYNDDDTWYNYELKDLKVIGNIFENP